MREPFRVFAVITRAKSHQITAAIARDTMSMGTELRKSTHPRNWRMANGTKMQTAAPKL